MQKRHTDKRQYFEEQVYTTEKYVIPFIERIIPVSKGMRVLEIGCGEAGNLKPFLDRECVCFGIDINETKIELGKQFYAGHPHKELLYLKTGNIYDEKNIEKYDIIFLRDVIEHIHHQESFLKFLHYFMHSNTMVFFAFPPWQNPFGGHQQICRSKLLSNLPFFHLLPKKAYIFVLKIFGEQKERIDELIEIKETGLSIECFDKYLRQADLRIRQKEFYFINPNYEVKFGLKPRKTAKIFRSIPYVRDFVTTCIYTVVSK